MQGVFKDVGDDNRELLEYFFDTPILYLHSLEFSAKFFHL